MAQLNSPILVTLTQALRIVIRGAILSFIILGHVEPKYALDTLELGLLAAMEGSASVVLLRAFNEIHKA